MKGLSDEELDKILTYEYLYEEYIVKGLPILKIAKNAGTGEDRLKLRLKKYNLTRKRNFNRPPPLTDRSYKIEERGFKVVSKYLGRHHNITVICNCGKEFTALAKHLMTGHTKSCGCREHTKRSCNFTGFGLVSGKYFRTTKFGAERRNLSFNITAEDIWNKIVEQKFKCAITGLDVFFDPSGWLGTASVDRIDNTKGYEIDNIQIVHKHINLMKKDHSMDYFLYLCSLAAKSYTGGKEFFKWETEQRIKQPRLDCLLRQGQESLH